MPSSSLAFLCMMAPLFGLYGCTADDISMMDPLSASDRHDGQRTVTSADGVNIHYDVSGNGEVMLVFVHGWSCDRSYWRHQIEAFNSSYTVVSLDLAGHGDSELNRAEWTMAAFGADVAAVVRNEQAGNVVLVGHSMGGPVILEAARLLGTQIKALIAVDTLKRPELGMAAERAEQAWSGIQSDFTAETEKLVRQRFFLPDADPELVASVAADMAAAPAENAILMGIGLTSYNSTAGLQATANIPLYLLNASNPPTDLAAYTGVRENVKLREFETGHFPMLVAPAEFNAVVQDTLSQIQSE